MEHTTRRRTAIIRGFTLVETLVSVFIITIVIVGPLTVASNASMYAKMTKDTMTATYLAQESIELLRHHQDSIYVRCADKNSSKCASASGENSSEAAWRIFKERLGGNTQGASCFTVDNAAGCSYDFIDMTSNEDFNPPKYVSTGNSCNTLSYDTSSRVYVCTGVRGTGLRTTTFSRSVKITSIPTFGGTDQSYNDDLRVTVTVTFRRPNGYLYQIKIVDFLHARA
jgi:type II secretory pathway pseudopilin PulG